MADPYADADLYDLEYSDYAEDIPFYVQRAESAGGSVLELGCGTGRLTLPMARVGARVVGVDRASAMIARLRERVAAEPPEVQARVSLCEADYGDLPAALDGEPFALLLWPFNALHHCASADRIHAVLAAARRRCKPGARLAMDCYLPAPHLIGSDPDEKREFREFTHPRTGERLRSWEQDRWDDARRVHHVRYVYQREGGEQHVSELALHMYDLTEIRRAVTQAGWSIVYESQDFRGTKLTPAAIKWVGVGRAL